MVVLVWLVHSLIKVLSFFIPILDFQIQSCVGCSLMGFLALNLVCFMGLCVERRRSSQNVGGSLHVYTLSSLVSFLGVKKGEMRNFGLEV